MQRKVWLYKMKAKKKKHIGRKTAVAPLYLFTTIFVLVPLIYMVVLSFLTKGDVWGVVGEFTLDNYKKIVEPVYLKTFAESIKLAFVSTFFVVVLGFPCGYWMAKLSERGQKRMMVLIALPFLTNSLLRLFGWVIVFRSNGLLDKLLMAIDRKTVKVIVFLSCSCRWYDLCIVAIYDTFRIFGRGKNGLVSGRGGKRFRGIKI